MHRKTIVSLLFLLGFAILLLGCLTLAQNSIPAGIETKHNMPTPAETTRLKLYQQIQTYAQQHEIKPIDATIDRVWKAIPGYNGKSVNVQASYAAMQAKGTFDAHKLVYRETAPKLHLSDLDPEPIYRGNPQKPMIGLLINVAWGNEYIPGILKTLDEQQTKATFFFDGSWVKRNPDLAKTIKQAGHEIGNHAYSHPDLKLYSAAETITELRKTNDIIKQTLGVTPKWFAPPSGSFNQSTVQAAHELNLKTILWTVDTIDWRKPETASMVERVVSRLENGSMILMHPTKPTAEGLGTIIADAKRKGLRPGCVGDLMDEKRLD